MFDYLFYSLAGLGVDIDVSKEKPILMKNLVRLSKGRMMGVDFNKNKTWVGSTIEYHEPL